MRSSKALSVLAMALAASLPLDAKSDTVTVLELVEGNAYFSIPQAGHGVNVHRFTFSIEGQPHVFYAAMVDFPETSLFSGDGTLVATSVERGPYIDELSATLTEGDYYLQLTTFAMTYGHGNGVMNVHAIPEPSINAMLLAGLSLIGGARLIRRRKDAA